ncbi:hypothetical protein [Bradyrhizobium sp. JR3.5]
MVSGTANNCAADSAITQGSVQEQEMDHPMIKTFIAAAGMAAVAYAVAAPAQAAHRHHMGVGCSGANFGKTEAAVEAMADNEVKFTAEKEVSLAQDAMLNNKWGACGAHLSKAAEESMAK